MASDELARLDALDAPFDPLEVLAWSHAERPYTRFVAWLLDPRAPRPGAGHDLGAAVLERLVGECLQRLEALPGHELAALPREAPRIPAAALRVHREAPLGDGLRETARAPDLRFEWRDPDGAPWLVVVENKMDADEGDGQVHDYLAWGTRARPEARRLLVYVTPDGRAPRSDVAGEAVVPLTWGELAEVALRAVPDATTPARRFARDVLEALVARFDGAAPARALVEALHDAHPRAAALAASPAADPALVAPLASRFPNAAWHLRALRPRAHRWTRAWADRVARAFEALRPEGPRLTACAPHAGRSDMASWSLEGVTDALALHLFCTAGAPLGGHRPRAWAALRAPGLDAAALFEAREQREALASLPPATRAWLLGATPAFESPGAWTHLCVGDAAPLPRGFSPDDDARRAARCLHGLVAPHLDALVAFARDPAQRLYAIDHDPEHFLPGDLADREALARDARPDAARVVVVTRQPTGHPWELRPERDLGASLTAAFGGRATLAWDYAPAAARGPVGAPSVVTLRASLLAGGDEASARAALEVVRACVAGGAWLLVRVDRWREDIARRLGPVAAPVLRVDDARAHDDTAALVAAHPAFTALAARGGHGLAPSPRAVLRDARAGLLVRDDEGEHALVAGWRAGAARVVFCPLPLPERARAEVFARTWDALVAFAAAL